MTMETIEPATPADVPPMADLLAVLFTQEAELTPDRAKQERALRLIVASPTVGTLFVARDGADVVGMVSLLYSISTAEGGPCGWLEDVVVRPDRRGVGLGTRLVRHAIDHARRRGLLRITLLADGVNAGAIRFYRRQGFTVSAMTTLRLDLTT